MSNREAVQNHSLHHHQSGAALLIFLLIAITAGLFAFFSYQEGKNTKIQREQITADALAQAKAALIAFAVSGPIESSGALKDADRPGELPCPDQDNDGTADSPCGNSDGSTGQLLRLGRLPWKTLGLPDLRDASGERLWYAVSSNFKKSTRYNAPLNSDTQGTISIRDALGVLQFDATSLSSNGVVAVVIAPGAPINQQNRDVAGVNQPSNYLDLAAGENNADFIDKTTNGFIAGPVIDATGTVISNDRLLWITTAELLPQIEKRVAGEVANCLNAYSQDSNNAGRLPWAANNAPSSYAEVLNASFGRLPDTPFSVTCGSSGGTWTATPFPHCSGTAPMTTAWPGNCSILSNSGWWLNWKEQVFFAIADNHKPAPSAPANNCGVSGYTNASACVQLDGIPNRRFVVIVSGKTQGIQTRPSALPSNYLEGPNATPAANQFTSSSNQPFNDFLKGSP